MNRRALSFILCIVVALTFSGCTQNSGQLESTASLGETTSAVSAPPPESTAAIQTLETTVETTVPAYEKAVDFKWKPYVMTEIYTDLYGDTFAADFQSMVSAFLAYESTFPCSSAEEADAINTASASCFPLLRMDVAGVTYDTVQQKGVLDYIWPEEDHMAGIKGFEDSVTEFITSCVMESDNDMTRALAIYMAYSRRISYDYSALGNELSVDLTSYRGLTEYSGICQTFGPAYAYLCLQMGIDAVTAGGLSTDKQAHEWTLVKLDGSYYYMDTTWENGDGAYGLKYFGMTSAERESAGNYTIELINVGDSNEIWGDDIEAANERFYPFRSVAYAEMNREMNRIDCTDINGMEWSFSLDVTK